MRNKKAICLLGMAVGLALTTACLPTSRNSNGPRITDLSPHPGETLAKGSVTIKVTATSSSKIAHADFWIDNQYAGRDSAGVADTFRCVWDATHESLGSSHVIQIAVYDPAGNSADTIDTVRIASHGGPTYHRGGISADETWDPLDNPHIIEGGGSWFMIGGRATLTVKPGCAVRLDSGMGIACGYRTSDSGTLIAVGTAGSPILFTSNAATPARGDWECVHIGNRATAATRLGDCTFEYGGRSFPGGPCAEIEVARPGIRIDNCVVRRSRGFGVSCTDTFGFGSFAGNTFTANASFPVTIYAQYVSTIGTGNTFIGNDTDGIGVNQSDPRGVTTSTTWPNFGVPYVITWSVSVAGPSGPILTIAPGTQLRLRKTADLVCGHNQPGAIVADGTGNRITFTTDSNPPARGSYGGIYFDTATVGAGSRLVNCNIEYAGRKYGSDPGGNIFIDDCTPAIIGDSIGHSGDWGIVLHGNTYPDTTLLRQQNQFYDNASGDVHVKWPWSASPLKADRRRPK